MVIFCRNCHKRMEYDEGEGNPADGFICFHCIEKLDADFNIMMDGENI